MMVSDWSNERKAIINEFKGLGPRPSFSELIFNRKCMYFDSIFAEKKKTEDISMIRKWIDEFLMQNYRIDLLFGTRGRSSRTDVWN